ncbi:MAG: hypothetical protein DI598_16955 [Pseudopedobacter saltans]|uniref:Uncharacterized protein n=1 Tax=Pseudopedobacter saltans TaxID=151895 RepID=A0A2W5EHA5_9SPHI|nr:MAG: hypothetical protein DI598_16955 [Pseudopedobacter saltans]
MTSVLSKSQSKLDSILSEAEKKSKEVFLSKVYTIKDSSSSVNERTYENQGMYSSTYLILKSDSSFVYYSVYEVGFDLSFGKWIQIKSDTILLNWDKKKTLDATKDKSQYHQYFAFSFPLPVSINNWAVKKIGRKLEPVKLGVESQKN